MPEPGKDELLAVRQVREELLRRSLRRRREVQLAADEERLHVRGSDAVVLLLAGPGQASTRLPPPQMKSVPGLPRIVLFLRPGEE